MDIRVAVTSAGLFMAVYLITLGVPFYFYRAGHHFAALLLAILLASIAPVLYARLRRQAEARLLKEERRRQAAIREAIRALGSFKEIDGIAGFLADLLNKELETGHAAFYEFNGSLFTLRYAAGKGRGYTSELVDEMPLSAWCRSSSRVIVVEEYGNGEGLEDDKLKEFIQKHPVAIAVPVRRGDNLLGLILLGEKGNGEVFTPGDLDVLSSVVEPAALAIENARFLKDINNVREQLFESHTMATIGFLVGGLAHQLRNRFASLLFYADFASRNVADHREQILPAKVCNETLGYLEKIVRGIDSGKEVLNGILNYAADRESRRAVNLKNLVASSVEFAGFKIPPGSVLFEEQIGDEVPPATGRGWSFRRRCRREWSFCVLPITGWGSKKNICRNFLRRFFLPVGRNGRGMAWDCT